MIIHGGESGPEIGISEGMLFDPVWVPPPGQQPGAWRAGFWCARKEETALPRQFSGCRDVSTWSFDQGIAPPVSGGRSWPFGPRVFDEKATQPCFACISNALRREGEGPTDAQVNA